MGRLSDLAAELRARRAGRKFVTHDIRRSARDIVGPTGDMFSNAWDLLDRDGTTYLESFDRRVPPSLFVSQRDRARWNLPIPLVERCLEDAGSVELEPDPDSQPGEWPGPTSTSEAR